MESAPLVDDTDSSEHTNKERKKKNKSTLLPNGGIASGLRAALRIVTTESLTVRFAPMCGCTIDGDGVRPYSVVSQGLDLWPSYLFGVSCHLLNNGHGLK